VHRAPRALSYSTSIDSKPENNEVSETIEALNAESVEDGKSADPADAADGNGAKSGKPRGGRKKPSKMLPRSKIALQALRQELAKDMTDLSIVMVKGKRSKRSIVRAQRAAEILEKLKEKKKAKESSRAEKAQKLAKAEKESNKSRSENPNALVRHLAGKPAKTASKSVKRSRKGEVSTEERESQENSTADSAENQDGTEEKNEKNKSITKRVMDTSSKYPRLQRVPSRARFDNKSFLQKNPTIAEKVSKLKISRGTLSKTMLQTTKSLLVRLVQDEQLSAAEKELAVKHLKKSSIVRKFMSPNKTEANEQQGIRSLKSAMTSKVPFRAPSSGPSAAGQSSTKGRERSTKIPTQVKLRSKSPKQRSKPGPIEAKAGMTAHEIKTIEADELELVPIDKEPPEVPNLSYGLERVLFNPGVYHLQDPRSRVFNFDPYLQTIMPVNDFDFSALKKYITSSRDTTLLLRAKEEEKKYTGSTSSMTSALGHFHFLLSQWRPINTGILSKMFPVEYNTFTALQRGPTAVFLRWRDGTYAIDADKEYDNSNILMMLGKSMEKLLTLSTEDFEKYRKANSDQISEEQRNESESFHYTTIGDFLLRSQLDAHDPRLPGTGMFDLKTRAVVSVRMDAEQYQEGKGYQIHGRHGEWESFEREYYDMIRAAFLKYSLQVRMGRMDGIFVAFHNTERIFGFQYISLPEMDYALHGTDNTAIGDSEFKLSLELLNRVLDRATAKFPEKSLRLHFETRDGVTPFMYIFAEPVEEEEIERIQATKKQKIEEFERNILGLSTSELTEEQKQAEWASLRAKVEERMEQDELRIENPDTMEEKDDSELDDLSREEQENMDDLMNTAAAEEDGEEHDDDKDILIEELEDDGEENLLEEDDDKESDEIILDDPENDLDCILESAAADDAEESDESLEESDPYNQAADEDVLSDDLEEADIDEDAVDEKDAFPDEESNEDELVSPESEDDNTELVENKELKSDETSSDSTTEEGPAASGFTISQVLGDGRPPLLAMTLIIRNKVNNLYVERPNKLQGHEKWAVEYALSEVPQLKRAHELYGALKARRRRSLTRNVDLTKDAWNNFFIENIKKLSRKGKAWREEQDKIEADLPIKTLDMRGGKKMSAEDRDVWQQGKKEE
jgi:hypothetical protein